MAAVGLLLASLAAPTAAQVRQPDETLSAGANSGPLSDVSRPVGEGLPVHHGAQTIGETSGGSVRSGPVRDAGTRSMLSGPMSEVSRGPVSQGSVPGQGGSVAEASAGAVKHDIDSPLGERISQPLRELGPLQKQMRAVREQAVANVVREASLPVTDLPADEAPPMEAAAAPPAEVGPVGEDVAPDVAQPEPDAEP